MFSLCSAACRAPAHGGRRSQARKGRLHLPQVPPAVLVCSFLSLSANSAPVCEQCSCSLTVVWCVVYRSGLPDDQPEVRTSPPAGSSCSSCPFVPALLHSADAGCLASWVSMLCRRRTRTSPIRACAGTNSSLWSSCLFRSAPARCCCGWGLGVVDAACVDANLAALCWVAWAFVIALASALADRDLRCARSTRGLTRLSTTLPQATRSVPSPSS